MAGFFKKLFGGGARQNSDPSYHADQDAGLQLPPRINPRTGKPQLLHIGFWRSQDNPHDPDPSTFVNPDQSPELMEQVAAKLDSGQDYALSPGLDWCRFRCEKQYLSSSLVTDGFLVWPIEFSHYVLEHHVALPDCIVQHLLSFDPGTVDYDTIDQYDRNTEWWRSIKGPYNGPQSFLKHYDPKYKGRIVLSPEPRRMVEQIRYLRNLDAYKGMGMGEVKKIIQQGTIEMQGEWNLQTLKAELDGAGWTAKLLDPYSGNEAPNPFA